MEVAGMGAIDLGCLMAEGRRPSQGRGSRCLRREMVVQSIGVAVRPGSAMALGLSINGARAHHLRWCIFVDDKLCEVVHITSLFLSSDFRYNRHSPRPAGTARADTQLTHRLREAAAG